MASIAWRTLVRAAGFRFPSAFGAALGTPGTNEAGEPVVDLTAGAGNEGVVVAFGTVEEWLGLGTIWLRVAMECTVNAGNVRLGAKVDALVAGEDTYPAFGGVEHATAAAAVPASANTIFFQEVELDPDQMGGPAAGAELFAHVYLIDAQTTVVGDVRVREVSIREELA